MSICKEYYVRFIEKKRAEELISSYHYLGMNGFRTKINFGLFNSDHELVGCAVYHDVSAPETVVGAFGLPRDHQEGILELGRMVLRPDHNGKNFGSYLIGRSLRKLKKLGYKYVISYASSDLHVGYIYQATNWRYYGLSDLKKDFYVWNGEKLVKQERGKTKNVIGAWLKRPQKHRYAFQLNKGLEIKWREEEYPHRFNSISYGCFFCEDAKKIIDTRTGNVYTCVCEIDGE